MWTKIEEKNDSHIQNLVLFIVTNCNFERLQLWFFDELMNELFIICAKAMNTNWVTPILHNLLFYFWLKPKIQFNHILSNNLVRVIFIWSLLMKYSKWIRSNQLKFIKPSPYIHFDSLINVLSFEFIEIIYI